MKKYEDYKVLFYETDKFLYYITSNKKVVKMREKLRDNFTFYRYKVPMTKEDYEMIKSKFDIDEVYEEKILSFRKNRGVRPKSEVELRWL